MFLKELVLRLKRTLWGQFLREICPLKMTPKYNAASGIIAGELLTKDNIVVTKNGKIILNGIRDKVSTLWMIPIKHK
jgi:hypothetical protein